MDQTQCHKDEETKMVKRYTVALDTRKFEIDLFWKRSLFFWGFIASAFVGFAAFSGANDRSLYLRSITAFFGLVCSFCWTLANRGSKYWQENWECHVNEVEDRVTGPLFKIVNPVQKKCWWLGARKFSVSKLTISLSDYVTVVWLGLGIYCLAQLPSIRSSYWDCYFCKDSLILFCFFFTLLWLVFVFFCARTSE